LAPEGLPPEAFFEAFANIYRAAYDSMALRATKKDFEKIDTLVVAFPNESLEHNWNAAERDALQAAITTMRESLHDPARFVTGDSAFHLTLLRAARNRVLERMTQPMHELLSYAQALTDAIPGVLARALAEHEAIADAIARRDAPGAREAMRVHLAQTQRDIIALTETT